jgi:hypothetical protein
VDNKIKIGRRINLPPWWFKKIGPYIITEKNDCVYLAILRSVIKKRTPHQFDYEEAKKKFVWEQDGYDSLEQNEPKLLPMCLWI